VVVVGVVAVDCVVWVVAGAATLLVVDVEEEAPQALTISVSRRAATGSRRCLMVSSRTPPAARCFPGI
jgi:hypothetical protein